MHDSKVDQAPSQSRPDAAILDEATQAFDGVEAALAALESGGYGRCAACGRSVDDADLEQDPTRLRCPTCR